MEQNIYVKDPMAHKYPINELSEEEKQKVNGLTFDFRELTPDHIVYGLSNAFGSLFHNFWKNIEDVAGKEIAKQISHRIGVKYGFINYSNFLKSHGGSFGTPALMCEFQDKIHSIRGTVHISARFGSFDDKKCVIVRKRCIYHEWHIDSNAEYHSEFYRGLFDGYRQADTALKRVENPLCLHKGNDSCKHIFVYKD